MTTLSALKLNYVPKKAPLLTTKLYTTLIREGKKNQFTHDFTVTPEVAKALLEKYNPKNRNLHSGSVDALVRDMKNGNWLGHVGDEVTIDTEGHLNNGQHRLAAIVQSELTQRMAFRFGMDPRSRLVEGRGRAKQYSDYVAMTEGRDTKHLNAFAASVRLLFGFLNDPLHPQSYSGNAKPTNSELNIVQQEFGPSLYESLIFVKQHKIGAVTVDTNAAVLHFLFKNTVHGEELADEFFEKFASGDNLASTDPRLVVRNRLMSTSEKVKFRSQSAKDKTMGLITKAWNAWLYDKKWSSKERTPGEMLAIDGLTTIGSYNPYGLEVEEELAVA